MQPQYLRNDLYQNHSPLFHVGSYIKKTLDHNDQVSERLLSLVFKNISTKEVIAIQGVIHNYNPFNEKLEETQFTLIEIPSFKPGTLHGETVFFKVHNEAVLFKVELKRVTYQGFETQNLVLGTYETIERPEEIDNFDKKSWMLHQINNNLDYVRDLTVGKTHYHCVCGAMNQIENIKCIQCLNSKEFYEESMRMNYIDLKLDDKARAYMDSMFISTGLMVEMDGSSIEVQLSSHGIDKLNQQIQNELNKFKRQDLVVQEAINKKLSKPLEILISELKSRITSIFNEIQQQKQQIIIEDKLDFEKKNKSIKLEIKQKLSNMDFLEANKFLIQSKTYLSNSEYLQFELLIEFQVSSVKNLFEKIQSYPFKIQNEFMKSHKQRIDKVLTTISFEERNMFKKIILNFNNYKNKEKERLNKKIIFTERLIPIFIFTAIFSMFPTFTALSMEPEEIGNKNLVLFFSVLLTASIIIVIFSFTFIESVKQSLERIDK